MLPQNPSTTQCLYRVAGIAVHDDHILLEKGDIGTWSPPGSPVQSTESARQVLKRTIHEALGDEIHVGQLLWVFERIFDWSGEPMYEMTFCLKMSFPPALLYFPRDMPITWIEQGTPVTFQWVPIEKLSQKRVTPPCLRHKLPELAHNERSIVYSTEQAPAQTVPNMFME
jgi:ADP-ribose pyrophosphatase YjhB (NUDIX family)